MDISEFVQNNTITLFFTFLFALILVYISQKIRRKKQLCDTIREKRMDKTNVMEFLNLNDLTRSGYLKGSINVNDTVVDYNYCLKDYYIKTAYNCFCSSGFRNGFVDSCALKNCASYGVRALHMQVFSLNQTPIIGVSSINTNDYKESYNNITFKDAISIIDDTYTSNDFGIGYEGELDNNLKNDPLFLILQLHYGTNLTDKNSSRFTENNITSSSNKIRFYNQIYETLINQFDSSRFAVNDIRRKTSVKQGFDHKYYVANIKMKDTKNKIFVFIIVNGKDNYRDVKNSKLDKIVDLYGDNEFNHYRFNDMNNSDNVAAINKYESKNSLGMCMPSLTSHYANYDFVQVMKNGTQFIGMNFQNLDSNMYAYNQFFIEQHGIPNGTSGNILTSPYIKKPDHMIELPLTVS